MSEQLALPMIEVSGSAREMGRAHGEQERSRIEQFVAMRLAAVRHYIAERGSDAGAFVELGRRCLAALEAWDPDGYAEHLGVASGAGVDPGELYATANMTDVRDILLYSDDSSGDEGCSALLLPPARTTGGRFIAAQTWDLNPEDLDYVVAVHRRPVSGPETWSVTCVGCPSLIGMNEHGVSVGTTNVKVRGTRVGIPYLSLLHRAIRSASREEALRCIREADRAAAHTYWVADERGATELECSAHKVVERDASDVALVRTNHCLDDEHAEQHGEEPNSSSRARFARLVQLTDRTDIDERAVKEIFADRSDGVDSINRFPEDEQGTATNACIICVPKERTMLACKGPADRGRWYTLDF